MIARESLILKLLGGNDKLFYIPVYQREYSWYKDNCERLMQDIDFSIEHNIESHFFGSIVYTNKELAGVSSYCIIDGQQRITTITLLLLAIYNEVSSRKKENIDDNGDQIILLEELKNNYFFVNPYKKNPDLKLVLTDDDNEIFRDLLLNKKVDKNTRIGANYDYFLDSIKDKIRVAILLMQNDMATDIIDQFRTILKFIYENSSNDNPIYENAEELKNVFVEMVMEFREHYTPVRNYLEQCLIGTRELLFDEETNTYYEEKFDKFVNFPRIRDRFKNGDSEAIKDKTTNSMLRYWQMNPKVDIYKDRFYKMLMKDYKEACWLDSEIRFDYEFSDFKYSELISFCAALLLIGEYYFLNQMVYYYGFIKENELIDGISKISKLSKEKVQFFLKYATYDYEYQKDKLTLIQSLIKGEAGYYFCASNLILGLLPIKMCRAIFDIDYKKYEKDISAIAKLKERQMTDSILDTLKKYDLDIKTGYQLKNKTTNRNDAEYDILIFDNKTHSLYIAECKWFYIGDGEEEHNKLDKKIDKAIKDRLIKDKFIIDNPKSFVLEAFGKDDVKDIKEILISQNFMGMKKHSMSVVDYETLKYSIGINDSFEKAMNYIYNDDYIESIDFDGALFDCHIEGFKFKIFRMVGKKN